MKVLYIISDRRSGSTLLENILSSNKEVTSLGELRLLKGHFLREGSGEIWDWHCSCGESIGSCAFWQQNYLRLNSMGMETKLRYSNMSIFKRYKYFVLRKTEEILREEELVLTNLYSIYSEVNRNEGTTVIVDSSKDVLTGVLLKKKYPNDVVLLNLRKDFRQVAASKIIRLKKKNRNLNQWYVLYSCWVNQIFQKSISNVADINTSYDEIILEREKLLNSIFSNLNIANVNVPSNFEVTKSHHTIAGTPNRFTKTKIAYDRKYLQFYKKNKGLSIFGWVLNFLSNNK